MKLKEIKYEKIFKLYFFKIFLISNNLFKNSFLRLIVITKREVKKIIKIRKTDISLLIAAPPTKALNT